MAQPQYKFKPYTPKNLKIATTQSSLEDDEKTLRSLEKQKENLRKRLIAEGVDPETLGGEFDNRNLIEKALNLRPDQGFLMDFFEVINRPVEAVKGGLMATTEDKSVLAGFWEGLSGQETTTGSEIAEKILDVKPTTGVGKFITDVGVDILLDPLTYLPAGFFLKQFGKLKNVGAKTITTAGKEIVETTTKRVAKIMSEVEQGLDTAKKLVYTDDEIKKILNVVVDTQGKGKSAEAFVQDTIQNSLKGTGLGDLGENYAVINKGNLKTGKGMRNQKDLALVYKIPDGRWVEISKIEVKDLVSISKKGVITKSSGFGTSTAIGIEDIANTVQDATQGYSPKKRFLELAGDVSVTVDGQTKTLKTYIEDVITNKKAGAPSLKGGKSSLQFAPGDQAKVDDALKTIFLEDLEASGVEFVSFRFGKNADEVVTISVKSLKDKKLLGIASASIGVKSTSSALSKDAIKTIGDTIGVNLDTASTAQKAGLKAGSKVKALGGGTFEIANSNIVVNLPNDEAAKKLIGSFQVGNDKITVTSVAKLDDGKYIFKTSKAAGDKPTRDLLSGILLVGEDGKRLSDDAIRLLDESQALGESLFTTTTTTTTTKTPAITETITLAERARRGEFDKVSPLIKRIARAYKNFEVNFKLTFGLTYGFDEKTANAVKAAYGENLFELDRRMARLSAIQKELIKLDPEAGELLGEIVEASARVVDGRIVRLNRRIDKSDFFDYILKRSEDGVDIILPSFADDIAKKNFVDDLNKLYEEMTTVKEEFFEVAVGPTGGTILKVKGGIGEIDEFIKFYKTRQLTKPTKEFVSFGEKALSKKSKALLLASPKLVEDYTRLGDEILTELIDKAGFDNLPLQLADQIGYMRHKMSKDAYAKLQETYGVKSIFAKPGSDALQKRTWLGSAQEINAALRDFRGLDMDLFDPNAFNAMQDVIKIAQRKMDQARVLGIILEGTAREGESLIKVIDNTKQAIAEKSPYDTVFKSFKEQFGALYDNLSPNAQKVLDDYFAAAGYAEGKAVVMNKSAFNVLKGAEKAYLDLKPMVKMYDKFLNFWKGVTLVSPGFHLRNMFGNMFNSYAIGMDVASQGKYLTVAVTELDQFSKIGKKLAQGLDVSPAEQKLFDTVRSYFEQGVAQTHRGVRDLEQVMESVAQTIKGNKIKTGYNNLVRFNFNVAEKMDDIQRYALYRWGLDKTGDSIAAAKKVREALFDYSHLTPFEKDYMKRIFPFYTFMKNNFIFQAKNIFANPKQYARLGRGYKYAVEDLSGYSMEDLPDYAIENMWIPIPMTVTKNDKDAIAFLKANLPISDFTELVENPFKKGVISITAPAKLLIEFGAGRDMFTGQVLQAFPGQTNAMQEGTGVLSGLRDKRGNFTITQSPLFQKILNDIGLRTPINVASVGMDLVDTLAGYQGPQEGLGDFLVRAGIVGVQETSALELTRLYQDLEKLRNLKKYYEQETGNQLPVLPRG